MMSNAAASAIGSHHPDIPGIGRGRKSSQAQGQSERYGLYPILGLETSIVLVVGGGGITPPRRI